LVLLDDVGVLVSVINSATHFHGRSLSFELGLNSGQTLTKVSLCRALEEVR
jgi:hypothetical protein